MARTVLLRLKLEPDIADDIRSAIAAWREAEMTASEGFSWVLNGHAFRLARLFHNRQQLLFIKADAGAEMDAEEAATWQGFFDEVNAAIDAEVAEYKANQEKFHGYEAQGESE